MQFVRLPPGKFVMGLPDEEINSVFDHDDAAVPHEVELTQPVWMAVCEVTRSDYDSVTFSRPNDGETESEADRGMPVSDVTWDDAAEFCERLSALPDEVAAGRSYRLPTEAEWEYACRAGRSEPRIHVPERQPGDASGENAMKSPPLPITRVGTNAPNEFGLFDMRGNVWEWCSDWSHPDYYAQSPLQDPSGPDRGYLKVVRGSDWLYVGQRCTLGFRATEPWLKSPFIGFRIVCVSSGIRE
jgi:formylglycine-generating enzyme required for sulfatase activity